MINLTRKIPLRFTDVPEETRNEVFNLYLNSEDNAYIKIGEKVGLNYSMVAKIVEIKMGEYRKNKTA